MPKPVVLALKLAVTGGLLVWIMSRVDLEAMRLVFEQADARMMVLAVLALIGALAPTGLRWWLLYRHLDPTIRIRDIAGAFWLGLFGNQVMPTSVGGDVIRTAYLTARRHQLDKLVSSAMVDRFLGVIATAILAAFGLAVVPVDLPLASLRWLPAVMAVAGAGAFIALTSNQVRRRVERRLDSEGHGRLMSFCLRLVHQLTEYGGAWVLLSTMLIASIVGQILVVATYALFGEALNVELTFGAYLFVVPLTLFVSSAPISLGGIGLRETSAVALLVLLGAGEQEAIGVSLLYLGAFLVLTLPGGLILLSGRGAQQDGRPTPPGQKTPATPPS